MDNNNVGYKKNRPIILLIALAGMTAYLLPYFRYYYYDAYLAYFGINDMQMGILGSVYGALTLVGYCLGGWVADRAPLKIFVPGSLIVTGAAGLLLLLKPLSLLPPLLRLPFLLPPLSLPSMPIHPFSTRRDWLQYPCRP